MIYVISQVVTQNNDSRQNSYCPCCLHMFTIILTQHMVWGIVRFSQCSENTNITDTFIMKTEPAFPAPGSLRPSSDAPPTCLFSLTAVLIFAVTPPLGSILKSWQSSMPAGCPWHFPWQYSPGCWRHQRVGHFDKVIYKPSVS